MQEEQVILVNKADEPIGMMPKMEAHEKGLLHRAFSIFIMNDKGETLLQQRAKHKYHSPLLWTNTCCSHPRLGETNIQAGKRRLWEEMGFTTELTALFSFIYKASFSNGLTEHEFDHVLIGTYNANPTINPREVAAWQWKHPQAIQEHMLLHPEQYTAWFKIIFQRFSDHLNQNPPLPGTQK